MLFESKSIFDLEFVSYCQFKEGFQTNKLKSMQQQESVKIDTLKQKTSKYVSYIKHQILELITSTMDDYETEFNNKLISGSQYFMGFRKEIYQDLMDLIDVYDNILKFFFYDTFQLQKDKSYLQYVSILQDSNPLQTFSKNNKKLQELQKSKNPQNEQIEIYLPDFLNKQTPNKENPCKGVLVEWEQEDAQNGKVTPNGEEQDKKPLKKEPCKNDDQVRTSLLQGDNSPQVDDEKSPNICHCQYTNCSKQYKRVGDLRRHQTLKHGRPQLLRAERYQQH